MELVTILKNEMKQEAETTRKMLSIVPEEKLDWQPHPKSMTLQKLVGHIAELPGWVTMAVTTKELDFENNPYEAPMPKTNAELLQFFDSIYDKGLKTLDSTNETELEKNWTLRSGEHHISTTSKLEVIRMAFCQIVHHRAQLGVYLRLLNIPIPGSYGPSADEQGF